MCRFVVEYLLKHFFLCRFFCLTCPLLLLLGCGGAETQAKIKSLQEKVNSLEERYQPVRDRLEVPLNIEFQGLDYAIIDQMFDPLLTGSVMIQASHEHLPQYAYLQLQVSVGFEKKNDVQLTKIFWVDLVDGKGKSSFQISLPEHRLDDAKASITFTPLSWYGGYPVVFSSIVP